MSLSCTESEAGWPHTNCVFNGIIHGQGAILRAADRNGTLVLIVEARMGHSPEDSREVLSAVGGASGAGQAV
jgi:hypothetical protein